MVLTMFVTFRTIVTTEGTSLATTPLQLDKRFLQDKSRNKVPVNCISPTSCRSYQKKYQKCCEQESKRYWPTRPLQNFYVFIKIQLNIELTKIKMDIVYLWTVDYIPIPSSRVETRLNCLKNQGWEISKKVRSKQNVQNFPGAWR